MRAAAQGQLWVARADEIVAALCLSEVPGGHWLTGLFVAPLWRGQQVARQLIAAALDELHGSVWLFCHPQLANFYARQGFSSTDALPAPLAERLARYQRSKPLLAMVRVQSSLAESSPGNSTSV
ncbi:N-acetyltransferase [Pseudomonas tructae]|uniref:N-acetyltransferase n=1 Tax=Pseudomonas tructae TaxID=2518644 RepID=A0A411MFX7_9PSED|nr:GNAT family N-acetyltransferase [Pseudomonas tructae]QBF25725.1 N-acetyltransferase [Pseudomonas tructae]